MTSYVNDDDDDDDERNHEKFHASLSNRLNLY